MGKLREKCPSQGCCNTIGNAEISGQSKLYIPRRWLSQTETVVFLISASVGVMDGFFGCGEGVLLNWNSIPGSWLV